MIRRDEGGARSNHPSDHTVPFAEPDEPRKELRHKVIAKGPKCEDQYLPQAVNVHQTARPPAGSNPIPHPPRILNVKPNSVNTFNGYESIQFVYSWLTNVEGAHAIQDHCQVQRPIPRASNRHRLMESCMTGTTAGEIDDGQYLRMYILKLCEKKDNSRQRGKEGPTSQAYSEYTSTVSVEAVRTGKDPKTTLEEVMRIGNGIHRKRILPIVVKGLE
jgi:hypothetical protein